MAPRHGTGSRTGSKGSRELRAELSRASSFRTTTLLPNIWRRRRSPRPRGIFRAFRGRERPRPQRGRLRPRDGGRGREGTAPALSWPSQAAGALPGTPGCLTLAAITAPHFPAQKHLHQPPNRDGDGSRGGQEGERASHRDAPCHCCHSPPVLSLRRSIAQRRGDGRTCLTGLQRGQPAPDPGGAPGPVSGSALTLRGAQRAHPPRAAGSHVPAPHTLRWAASRRQCRNGDMAARGLTRTMAPGPLRLRSRPAWQVPGTPLIRPQILRSLSPPSQQGWLRAASSSEGGDEAHGQHF